MRMGFIGLGKMGYNMVLQLIEKGNSVVAYNRTRARTKKIAKEGAIPTYSIEELFEKLPKRKIIWLMITAGKPVDEVINKLLPYLRKDDIVIDGGNSYYLDSIRRYNKLKEKGVYFLDCGTSGGIEGARYGASLMIGGDKLAFKKVEKIFKDLSVKNGYSYVGKSGAGHFVKMVHNAIEYGMIGAISEGFLAIEKKSKKFDTKLKDVARVYAHGSIIGGKLMTLLFEITKKDSYLDKVSCEVPEGETEKEMKMLERMDNMPILRQARLMRVNSRKHKVCGKIIAALRNRFGGHKVILKR